MFGGAFIRFLEHSGVVLFMIECSDSVIDAILLVRVSRYILYIFELIIIHLTLRIAHLIKCPIVFVSTASRSILKIILQLLVFQVVLCLLKLGNGFCSGSLGGCIDSLVFLFEMFIVKVVDDAGLFLLELVDIRLQEGQFCFWDD